MMRDNVGSFETLNHKFNPIFPSLGANAEYKYAIIETNIKCWIWVEVAC